MTVDFTFEDGATPVATGSFTYSSANTVLSFTDLTAFAITIGAQSYDLAFMLANTNYRYFSYDTVSGTFIAGPGSGLYGPVEELLGTFADTFSSGFLFQPLPYPGVFTEITQAEYDAPYTAVRYSRGDPVPEPGSLALFASALASCAFGVRRCRARRLA